MSLSKRILIPIAAVWIVTFGAAAAFGDDPDSGLAVTVCLATSIGVTVGTLFWDWRRKRRREGSAG